MAGRCGCTSDRCSCVIVAGEGISIQGGGTQENPIVVTNIAGAAVDPEAPEPVADGHFIGEVIMYGGSAAPAAGWLLCNGAAVSRTVYSALFAVLGTTHGAGDGSTTFNLPPQGRFVYGADATNPRGTQGGATTVTLATANLPAHTHSIAHAHAATVSGGLHDHQITRSDGTGTAGANIPRGTNTVVSTTRGAILEDGAHTHTIPAYTGNSGSTGSGTAVDKMPPWVSVPLYIKAL